MLLKLLVQYSLQNQPFYIPQKRRLANQTISNFLANSYFLNCLKKLMKQEAQRTQRADYK